MIIVTRKCGRLGNRLLLMSHLIAYGVEKGHRVIDITFDEYAQFFVQTVNNPHIVRFPATKSWLDNLPLNYNLVPSVIYNFARVIRKLTNLYPKLRSDYQFFPSYDTDWGTPVMIDDIDVKKIIFIRGWYVRAPQYFVKHSQLIREWFTPLPKFQENVKNLCNQIRQSSDIVVGLHIRAGDYRIYGGFYPLPVWKSTMKRMTDFFTTKKVAFLICSDEDFRSQRSFFSEFIVYFGTGHIIEDLYSLACCDYLIAPPSTYSNWAAF